LLWIYYSAQIFLLGAEFTQVWARRYGTRMAPKEGAVRVEVQPVGKPVVALAKRLSEVHQAPPKPASIPKPVPPPKTQAPERPTGPVTKLPSRIDLSKMLLYALASIGFVIGLILGGIAGSEPEETPQR
jgi:hypothetical protein